MRGVRFDKGLILVLVIVAVVAGATAIIAINVRTDVISDLVDSGGMIPVLVVIEREEQSLVTEVFLYDAETSRAALFDIPASTGVVVESVNRVDTIDTTFYTDGIDTYRSQIAAVVGTDIPFHLVLSPESLEMLIDLIEGVPIFIADIPNEGPEAVQLPNGDAVLDGSKARLYLEYRDESERTREPVSRQQRFVTGLLGRMGEMNALLADPPTSRLLSGSLQTNIDRQAFISFTRELGNLESDRVITRQVEGLIRTVETDGESEELLFPHQEGRWLQESVRQVVENLSTEEAIRDENIVIRLEILNATETTGLASRTAELYRSYGFDVVTVGNAAVENLDETLVIDRVGSDVFAQRTADIIRAPAIEIDVDPSATVDVTIVLGKDFDGRYVR